MRLPPDWREFIELLNSHGVEYVVVGGHAVGFHGFPRYTGDIDFFVRPGPENAARLVAVLEAFGFTDADELRGAFAEADKVVQLALCLPKTHPRPESSRFRLVFQDTPPRELAPRSIAFQRAECTWPCTC